jgi:hypothetical protein
MRCLLRFPSKLRAGLLIWLALACMPAMGVLIIGDPEGFEDIPWGAIFSQMEHFVKVEDDGRLQTYERTGEPPVFGGTPVDSVRFTAYEGKFGRVTVRYRGKDAHERILSYLQSKYGSLDRTPGQISVGPVKVHAWHGLNTQVTLRFEANVERGIIFFESRMLREALLEGTSGTAF